MNPSRNPFVVFWETPFGFLHEACRKEFHNVVLGPRGGQMTQQEMLLAALNSQGQFMDLLRVYNNDVAAGNVYDG